MSRKRNHHTGLKIFLILLMLLLLAGTGLMIRLSLELTNAEPETTPAETVTLPRPALPSESVETTAAAIPEPEFTASTATIGAMGDLLMHKPIFDNKTEYNAAVQQPDGSYDFTSVFQYLTEYTAALDYAAINLETTLAGEDNGYPYAGYPLFNCPDAIVDGVKAAGFDMVLTANNHSCDTGIAGYKRTLEVIREKGLETLGTYASAGETKWTIQEINGIHVGMLCYTWALSVTEDGRPSLNGTLAIPEAGICNYFYSGNLPAFYGEVEAYLTEMKEAGAEATVLYIHWGNEYVLTANEEQQAIAQALCDLGIDVIIGGHPHVIQPIELLESTRDPGHKTVCLYSTGNAVSNQRKGNLKAIKTAHTEDGILFSVTFERDEEGKVSLSQVDALPTWVNMHTNSDGRTEYNILPLDYSRVEEWADLFDIDESTLHAAEDSYNRTMDIITEGLADVQEYLEQNP